MRRRCPGHCSSGRLVTALTAWPGWPAASEPIGEPGGSHEEPVTAVCAHVCELCVRGSMLQSWN
jgi:hypothetical protein